MDHGPDCVTHDRGRRVRTDHHNGTGRVNRPRRGVTARWGREPSARGRPSRTSRASWRWTSSVPAYDNTAVFGPIPVPYDFGNGLSLTGTNDEQPSHLYDYVYPQHPWVRLVAKAADSRREKTLPSTVVCRRGQRQEC